MDRKSLRKEIKAVVNDGLDLAFENIMVMVDLLLDDHFKQQPISSEDQEDIKDLQGQLRDLLEEDEQSYIKFAASNKIKGPKKNDAFQSKRGQPFWYLYIRPSGHKWYVPENGSADRMKGSFKLVARMAVPKLRDEIRWVKDGKPADQKGWNKKFGSQHKDEDE